MGQERNLDILFTVFADLPRVGPGDAESTLRALAMCKELPEKPAILDMGCGTGLHTVELAAATKGAITCVDFHQPFLDQLKANAAGRGVADQITTMAADMAQVEFPDQSFDLIWCEGAMFAMGFDAGLAAWLRWLKPGGYVAVSELCWFEDEPPGEAVDFFARMYPPMRDEAANVAALMRAGYLPVGSFDLPDESWWEDFYAPLETRLPAMREKFADNPEGLAFVDETQTEINMHREHGYSYGYAFFVGRRP